MAQKKKIATHINGLMRELDALGSENEVLRDHVARFREQATLASSGSDDSQTYRKFAPNKEDETYKRKLEDQYWVSNEQEKRIMRLEADKSELKRKVDSLVKEGQRIRTLACQLEE